MPRYPTTTAELDEAERRWWSDNSDIEEAFCWVQTPDVQRVLRGRYLRAVTDLVGPGTSVLELGCGTGWFSLLLAGTGVADVVGLDFSPEQIDRARTSARQAGLEDRVHFEVTGDPSGRIGADRRFDVVVMHAFLHHLATDEVRAALDEAAARLIEGGTLVLVEPLHHVGGPASEPVTLKLLRRLEQVPRSLHRRGLRRSSRQEEEVRGRMAVRHVAGPPFGPSPKETPFTDGELEALLAPRFEVARSQPCLCMSHLVAQELLIAGLSQPRLWNALRTPVLGLARALDGRFLHRPELPSTVWVFQLYVCTKRSG